MTEKIELIDAELDTVSGGFIILGKGGVGDHDGDRGGRHRHHHHHNDHDGDDRPPIRIIPL